MASGTKQKAQTRAPTRVDVQDKSRTVEQEGGESAQHGVPGQLRITREEMTPDGSHRTQEQRSTPGALPEFSAETASASRRQVRGLSP